MISKKMIVKNENGLGARSVAVFVQIACQYDSKVFVEYDNKKVNAKSIMGMMSLGLAEKREEIVLDDGRENLLLPRDGEALKVLIRLRDEAHRFAISFHRHLRGKILHASALDAVPGIGPAKKAMLLRKFGSVARLATASVDEIATMPGIGRELAEAILRIL